MDVNRADLHTHTTASDGVQKPSENVRLAKEAGLAAIAITDHDTIDGIAEAMEAGTKYGITVVPGVEISTVANGKDIHILGYYTNWQDERWRKKLLSLLDTREHRNLMIIERLQGLGIPITMEEVIAEARQQGKDGGTIGRPHIAAVLIAKATVSNMQEAFDQYLSNDGAAYANPPGFTHLKRSNGFAKQVGQALSLTQVYMTMMRLVEAIIQNGVRRYRGLPFGSYKYR